MGAVTAASTRASLTRFAEPRALGSLTAADAAALGPEARDFARLCAAGVPVAEGWVVPVPGEPDAGRVVRVAEECASSDDGRLVELRPWFVSPGLAARCEKVWPSTEPASGALEASRAALELVSALGSARFRSAIGGPPDGVLVRVIARRAEPTGSAASCDPQRGDPDLVVVWTEGADAWQVDRKTMRLAREGAGPLDEDAVGRIADLADRAQLVLGRPVEVDWCLVEGRPQVVAVRTLHFRARFTPSSHRRLALVAADEGTVAPLAVDALDKALRQGDDPSDEPRVRRAYARPYRRVDESRPRLEPGGRSSSLARAAGRAARVAADVAAPVAAASQFERALAGRLAPVDALTLERLDDAALIGTLRERMRLVVEAIALLDRERAATVAVLPGLEAVVGTLPRECVDGLAAPRNTRARDRVVEKLARLASAIVSEAGSLVGARMLSASTGRMWRETAESLTDVRMLGIDIRHEAIGASESAMLEALGAVHAREDENRETARRDAVRRLRATARMLPFGVSREVMVASLCVMLARVADAKGRASEAVAATMLRLRAAAVEAGRRLVDTDVLDAAEDTLYLDLEEIEQALEGEPGAYAARVRLRREDDSRWAELEAPRRIDASPPSAP